MKYDVLLCTYNGEKYIVEQLKSIIEQTVKPHKVFIGDDQSSDRTVEFAKAFLESTDVKFEIEVNQSRLGYANNFMNQAKKVTSEIAFFCDQDDIWLRNKAEIVLHAFADKPKTELVFTNAQLVNDGLEHLKHTLWQVLGVNEESTKLTYQDTFLKRNIVTGATMAVRRERLLTCLNTPNASPHDYWLASVCAMKSTISFLPDCLILYRQHSNNVLGANKRGIKEKLKSLLNRDTLKTRRKNNITRLHILKQAIEDNLVDKDSFCKELKYLEHINTLSVSKKLKLTELFKFSKCYRQFDSGYKYLLMDIALCFYDI